MWTDKDGMGHINGVFDPVRFEAISDAINAHVNRLANAGGVTKNDNLAATAAFELLTGGGEGRGSVPHINLIVDYRTAAEWCARGFDHRNLGWNPPGAGNGFPDDV